LAYAHARVEVERKRPTRLLVIGIMSLILGAITVLANGYLMATLCRGYARSIPPPAPPPLPAIPAANVIPHAGDFVRASGLREDDRKPVLQAVATRIKLPPDRAILLERFLADIGRDAFGDPLLSARELARDITSVGQEAKGPDGAGELGTHFIVTPRGRLTLDNGVAVFAPSDGRTIYKLDGNILEDARDYEKHWCAAALNEWIEALHRRDARQMTAEQAAVLLDSATKLKAKMPRDFRDDFGFVPAAPHALRVEGYMGEVLTAVLDGHEAYLLPDGRIADRNIYRWGLGPPPEYKPNPQPTPPFTPALPGSLESLEFVIAEAAVQLAVGVLMIVAGMAQLLQKRNAPHLHALWAVLKVVLTVASLALTFWYASTVPAGMKSALVSPPRLSAWMTFALAYPVTVFLVLRARSVRRHYGWDRRNDVEPAAPDFRSRIARFAASPFGGATITAGGILAALAAVGHLSAIGSLFIYGDSINPMTMAAFGGGLCLCGLVVKVCTDLRGLARRGAGDERVADALASRGELA
jgi:hypothetical protein